MIRGHAKTQLVSFAEPLIWAGVTFVIAVIAYQFRAAHWSVWVVFGALLVVALAGLYLSLMRRFLRPSGHAEGVVLVDEARVGFFEPGAGGGFVDLDALLRLEVRGPAGERRWVLHHEGGAPLEISQNAPGADQLLDVFASLSGLGLVRFASALRATDDTDQVLWRRASELN